MLWGKRSCGYLTETRPKLSAFSLGVRSISVHCPHERKKKGVVQFTLVSGKSRESEMKK